MIRNLPFTGLKKNAQTLANTQIKIPTTLDNNPITDLTNNMRKKCTDEQIYGIPIQIYH